MDNIFTNLNTIVTITGIVIGLPSVYFLIKRFFDKKKVLTSNILELESQGLIIENQELLYEDKSIDKLYFIYFPVVPTRTPNIIHLLFCNYLKKMISCGLRVKIFVFDSYYQLLKGKSNEISKSDVDNFVNLIEQYLGTNKIKVIKESRFIKRKGKRILRELYTISHNLTLGDINNIQKGKQYINEDVVFLRYMKPISNMLYLKQTSKKYGFTLSGLDEKELWDLFEKTRDSQKYKLCNFYIPKVEGLKLNSTDVLDTTYNISFGEKFESVLLKVEEYFDKEENFQIDTCIALYLKLCIFQNGIKIQYNLIDGNLISIPSWSALVVKLSNSDSLEKNNLLQSIAKLIYSNINNKN